MSTGYRKNKIIIYIAILAIVLFLLILYLPKQPTKSIKPTKTQINLSSYFGNYTSIIGPHSSLVFFGCNLMINLTDEYNRLVAPLAAFKLVNSSYINTLAQWNLYTLSRLLNLTYNLHNVNLTIANKSINYLYMNPLFSEVFSNATLMNLTKKLSSLSLLEAENYENSSILLEIAKKENISLNFPIAISSIYYSKDIDLLYQYNQSKIKNVTSLLEKLYPIPNWLLSNNAGLPNLITFFAPVYALPIKYCGYKIINVNPQLNYGLIQNESSLGINIINISV